MRHSVKVLSRHPELKTVHRIGDDELVVYYYGKHGVNECRRKLHRITDHDGYFHFFKEIVQVYFR